jgi:hypothetical protein
MKFQILNSYWAKTELGTHAQRAFGLPWPSHSAERTWGSAARNQPRPAHGQHPRAQDAHGA